MNKQQSDILQFLSKYKSCTEEQLAFFTKCSKQDINYMLSSNFIVKDEKTKLLHHKLKRVDTRTAVALDVVKINCKEIREISYSKNFPVIFTIVTVDNKTCDIAVVRSVEQDTVFKKINNYSKADKLILVLENEQYNKSLINTNKEVLICKYPIQIIDKVN